MSENYLNSSEINEYASLVAEQKLKMPLKRVALLAFLAGMYIGFGGLLVVLVGAGTAGLPYGLVKILAGLVFSIGLILVVVGGGELFTGNTIVVLSGKKDFNSWYRIIKNWMVVYFGNLFGAILLAVLVILSGQYQFGGGLIAESMFKIAGTKLAYNFFQALVLGILCNIFVCLALWLSYAAKDVAGKILAIIFPITAFVALGFEHSVANMYLLFSAFFLKIFNPAEMAMYHGIASLNLSNIFLANLLPVTIGNIIGGLLIWFTYHFAYKK